MSSLCDGHTFLFEHKFLVQELNQMKENREAMGAYSEKTTCPARQRAPRDLCSTEWKVMFTV